MGNRRTAYKIAELVAVEGLEAPTLVLFFSDQSPCDPAGSSPHVTMLGDAARLGAKLIEVERGDIQPAEALRVYEDEMTTYGFGVVRAAAKKGALVIAQNPLPE